MLWLDVDSDITVASQELFSSLINSFISDYEEASPAHIVLERFGACLKLSSMNLVGMERNVLIDEGTVIATASVLAHMNPKAVEYNSGLVHLT